MKSNVPFLLLALAIIAIAVGGFYALTRDRSFDPDFDVTVARPAHTPPGPVLLYDEGHLNTHTADGGYKPFLDLMRNDGCRVEIQRSGFSEKDLNSVPLCVIVCPRGPNDAGDSSAFTGAEIDLLDAWVRRGGAMLLITDHWPFGMAAARLGERLGVLMGGGLVEDSTHCDPELGPSHIVFSKADGTLGDHPLLPGRGGMRGDDGVARVLTFTGQSLEGPAGSSSLLPLSEAAVEYPPTAARIEREGGDVRVHMEYGTPVPLRGRSQGLAFRHGAGRVVVLGESGMFRAYHDPDDSPIGMNREGFDNRNLALNIVRWLLEGHSS